MMPPDTMPPMDPNAMPPMGQPPMGAPQPQPTPQDVAAAAEKEQALVIQSIIDTTPTPEKPYKASTLAQTIKAINALAAALGAGPDLVVTWTPEQGQAAGEGKLTGGDWDGKLPPAIYLPLFAINETLSKVPDGERWVKAHGYDPTAITTNPQLEAATGKILGMTKDKKFIEAASAPPEMAAPMVDGEGMSPEEMDNDLMASV